MRKLILIAILFAGPAWAEVQLYPMTCQNPGGTTFGPCGTFGKMLTSAQAHGLNNLPFPLPGLQNGTWDEIEYRYDVLKQDRETCMQEHWEVSGAKLELHNNAFRWRLFNLTQHENCGHQTIPNCSTGGGPGGNNY